MGVKPGYKRTEVGLIPEEWEIRPFLSIVRIANGQVDPRHEPYRSMTLVAPDHIESGTGRLLDKKTAAEQGAVSGKYVFGPHDVLYSKIRPYLRKATLANFHGLCSADMYPLRPAPDISPGFVLPLVLGERFSAYAESVSARSGMPKINRAELAEFLTAVPPIQEQRAIATALSDIDGLLTQLDRLIAKKRDIKQAAMQQLLTGKTRLPGFGGEWATRTIGELATTYGGLVGKSKADFGAGDAQYVTFLNVMSNSVVNPVLFDRVRVPSGEPQNLVRQGDLLLNGSSETPEEVGMCALVACDVPDLYLNSFCFGLRLRDEAKVDGLFLSYLIRGEPGRDMMKSLAQGSTRYNISKAAIRDAAVSIPELQEQTAIATLLSDLDAELAALEARRDKTRALKQGMMQELLTGRTRLI